MEATTKKQLVPKLRFNEFDGEWRKGKLGDIGKVKMCKRIFSNETSEAGDIPFYKIGTFGKKPDAFITKEHYLDYKKKFSFPRRGEILISASGTIGRTVVYDGESAYYQDSNIVWLDNDELLVKNKLLYYLYQIVRYESEGGTIQRLYNSIILGTKIYFPTLPEQEKIASFLGSVDQKIALLQQKKKALELYKKGVMQQLFSQQLCFKDPNGNHYPDWETKKLGEVCESIKSGKSKLSDDGIIPLYGSTGIIGKCLESSHQGEFILIARVGANAGTINLIDDCFGVSDNTLIVVCKPILEIGYAYYFLSGYNLKRLMFGSGQPLITGSQLKALKLKLPSLEEQQKIANFLSAIDVKIEACASQLQKTQTFKKGLLQQMFV
ncbi:restriction endonuclease subunit S [Wenyingzhuangia aestuarii]|uniref:restriction endonuclease subunit S n=1 Tax=Wenyingzhuangia aestuarii TaxID=1647582 RepID=UPI001439276F|nr:restriction endonuclease subunit S [Wenyingzhuangia aestuarii]NJB82820.1 type I restriction enzyme S subunit [Wenyingzhuangia aestuarii]